MRRVAILSACVTILGVASLFVTSLFDRSARVKFEENPLWDANEEAKTSPLTKELRSLGLEFRTGMGAEADPTGIAFAETGSDEYWIVTFVPETNEIHVSSFIHDVNWIGHLTYDRRFRQIRDCIMRHSEHH